MINAEIKRYIDAQLAQFRKEITALVGSAATANVSITGDYVGTSDISVVGNTIGLSASRLATYNENYVNIAGGTGNAHPYMSWVVGNNTLDQNAMRSVVFGRGNVLNQDAQDVVVFGRDNDVHNSVCFVCGFQLKTAGTQCQTILGKNNVAVSGAYLVVGNGETSTTRNNAFVVKTNGDGVFDGDIFFNGGTLSDMLRRIVALEAR